MTDASIVDAEIRALFDPLKGRAAVLAVSGGIDSMAMMGLVARWRRLSPESGGWVHVLTLDHGFRPEAAQEVAFVCAEASKLALPATALHWASHGVRSGFAARARTMRYTMFASWMAQYAPPDAVLLTAHTLEDRAEGLLMRLARGSGLRGLAGIEPWMVWSTGKTNMRVHRPLLTVPKSRLAATLEAAGVGHVTDPTNADVRSERGRWRRSMPGRMDLGLTDAAVGRSAARLDRARQTLRQFVALRGRAHVQLNHGVRGVLRLYAGWRDEPEIVIQLVEALITAYGGQEQPVRLSAVEALYQCLVDDGGDGFSRTVGGARVIHRAGEAALLFEREMPRVPVPALPFGAGDALLWDGRFWLSARGPLPMDCRIMPLGVGGWRTLVERWPEVRRLPRRATASLPVVCHDGQIIGFPLLDGASGLVQSAFAARGVHWVLATGSAEIG